MKLPAPFSSYWVNNYLSQLKYHFTLVSTIIAIPSNIFTKAVIFILDIDQTIPGGYVKTRDERISSEDHVLNTVIIPFMAFAIFFLHEVGIRFTSVKYVFVFRTKSDIIRTLCTKDL